MGKKAPIPNVKIVIIGSTGVGKYSLSQQYAKGWIAPKEGDVTDPSKVATVKGAKYDVKVAVCKDIEADDALKGSDGAILVYSVTDKKSLAFVKNTAFQKLHEVLGQGDGCEAKNGSEKSTKKSQSEDGGMAGKEVAETPTGQPADLGLRVPVILVGNKVDDAKLARAIEEEEGAALSKELRCLGFFETAATCNANVPQAFDTLLEEIASRRDAATGGGASSKAKTPKATKSCCTIS